MSQMGCSMMSPCGASLVSALWPSLNRGLGVCRNKDEGQEVDNRLISFIVPALNGLYDGL